MMLEEKARKREIDALSSRQWWPRASSRRKIQIVEHGLNELDVKKLIVLVCEDRGGIEPHFAKVTQRAETETVSFPMGHRVQ